MRVRLIAHGVAAGGVTVTLLAVILMASVPTTAVTGQPPTSGYVVTSDGLELHVSLNSSSLATGQTVEVAAWIFNPSTEFVNASSSDGWARGDFAAGPCGVMNYPVGILMAKGNYSLSNLEDAQSLQIYDTGAFGCPMVLSSISGFGFQPNSSLAAVYGSCSSPSCFTEDATVTGTFSGWYGVTHVAFAPGVYTVVAGDIWGGMALLHFVVS
ncbi:MAG TPA: hypothetical protein VMS77_05175 [Conexivisphaerales archaeon]|nr:hypothetical protein [Conexivisphaerales archaeon]